MAAVSTAFGSLGRTCMTLDAGFRIRSASSGLDALLGPGTAQAVVGKPAEAVVGEELVLGVAGNLRSTAQIIFT